MLLLYSLIDFPFIYVLILDRRCTAQQPGTSDCIFSITCNAIETRATLYARSNITGKTLDVLHA